MALIGRGNDNCMVIRDVLRSLGMFCALGSIIALADSGLEVQARQAVDVLPAIPSLS
jgi:hypothetical protein